MRIDFELLAATPFATVYEGNDEVVDEPVTSATPETPAAAAAKKNAPTFTEEQQRFLNAKLADEKRKGQKAADELVLQLQTEQQRSGTTEAEKQALQKRIETLQADYASQDELKRRAASEKVKALEEKVKEKEAGERSWKERYEKTMKLTALTSAAAAEKAYSTEQVVTLLESKTRLEPVVGEDGKPTGDFEPRVKIQSKDKDGKVSTLDLTPADAVREMKNMSDYANLFISPAMGGLGGSNLGGRGTGGQKKLSELSTEEYMRARAQAKTGK